jgi:type II secretion system protein G
MRYLKFALIPLVAAGLACLVYAIVTVMHNRPRAAVPETAGENEIKVVLRTFTQAMYDADEKAVFDCFYFASDQDRQEARVFADETMDAVRMQHALDAEFGTRAATTAPEHAPIPPDLLNRLSAAQVTVIGDTADARLGTTSAIFLIRKDNVWKIDFSKTQRTQRGPYNKDRVAALAARSQAVHDVIAEIQAHQYSTREEAQAALDNRLAELRPPEPATNAAGATTSPTTRVRTAPTSAAATTAPADAPVAARNTLILFRTAIETFEVDIGRYPSTAEGLGALRQAPAALAANWSGPYLDKLPLDPWGHPYIYRCPGTDDPTSYDLLSAGPDGKEGTSDDITKEDAAK